MEFKRLLFETDHKVARVTLNRSDIHNAFDPIMIHELHDVFSRLADDHHIQVVVLTGQGKSFCAGADLSWMKSLANATYQENIEDAQQLEKMMRAVGDFPKPLINLVNGPAIGGGCGLACCADIVLAYPEALFGLSEVRLGILPAVIAPYVMRRIGFSASSRYMLSGERFDAQKAKEINLANEVVERNEMEVVLDKIIQALLKGGIEAQKHTKKLIREIIEVKDNKEISSLTAQAIAQRRVSDEGQEGMNAFFEKRLPSWADQ